MSVQLCPPTIAEALDVLYPPRIKNVVFEDPHCGAIWVAQADLRRNRNMAKDPVCPYCGDPRPLPLAAFDDFHAAIGYQTALRYEKIRAVGQTANIVANLAKFNKERDALARKDNIQLDEPIGDGSFFEKWLRWKSFPTPHAMGFNTTKRLFDIDGMDRNQPL